MKNESVLSLGLFGRLSALEASRRDVLNDIAKVREYRIKEGLCSESSEPPEEILANALPLLLTELNGLLESLVLSDRIIEFQGYSPYYVAKLAVKHRHMGLSRHLRGWDYTQVWPEEANQLRQRCLERLKVKSIVNSNPTFYEVELALGVPYDAFSFSIMNRALDEGRLDLDFCRDNTEEWEHGSDEDERAGWDKLKDFVDKRLGPDWVAYRSAIDAAERWPSGLAVQPHVSSPMTSAGLQLHQERKQWQFKYGLYTEFLEALKRNTLAVSGFATGNYYRLLTGSDNALAYLVHVVSHKYVDVVRAKLEEVGYLCLDVELPPILRLCLRDARTIGDVIDRALQWRTHRWFVKLRDHLADLAVEERPEKLVRYLKRLQDHIEASIAGLGAGVTTGLAISSTGSLSLSIPSIGRQLLSWRNPVVYVHSQVSKTLGFRDSVGDLARVLSVSRTEAISLIRNVDLLDRSSAQAPFN